MLSILLAMLCSGCALVPDVRHKPQYHNPFPQLQRIAILPFQNQSNEPTLSGSRVAMAYYDELQSIPGFEVVPMGVIENEKLVFEQEVLQHRMGSIDEFQQFARHLQERMDVDAVLQGSITDFDSYYPPRMTLKVNWYAANPGFHRIPVGYGLPWGTKKEKDIPEWIRLEAERELAREQLKTQTPDDTSSPAPQSASNSRVLLAQNRSKDPVDDARIPVSFEESSEGDGESQIIADDTNGSSGTMAIGTGTAETAGGDLPIDWPDPQGFIPAPPSSTKPALIAQYDPIITHMKSYHGNDEDFTEQLESYHYFRDEARLGGWQSYLQRSEDFIRFCCHLHVTETLAARGGQLDSRLILRWPIDRYDR